MESSIFQACFFGAAVDMTKGSSNFIRPMHPKTEIRAERSSMAKVLEAGWVGQIKIHGHRAQIHLPADPSLDPVAYNRQGQPHKLLLPAGIVKELRRVLQPVKDWSVVDAEWLKPEGKLFLFDFIKKDGDLLARLTYPERWKLLPRAYISPHISTLPLITDLAKCLNLLERRPEHCEGLVFKSSKTRGFADTSIVRCRFPQ